MKIKKTKKNKKILKSMFGALKGKTKSFTRKERKNMLGDEHRFT